LAQHKRDITGRPSLTLFPHDLGILLEAHIAQQIDEHGTQRQTLYQLGPRQTVQGLLVAKRRQQLGQSPFEFFFARSDGAHALMVVLALDRGGQKQLRQRATCGDKVRPGLLDLLPPGSVCGSMEAGSL
jgi:hypothetical protein